MIDLEAVVQGWFAGAGDLWWNHVGESIPVNSPMLFPSNSMTLALKGVVHKQDTEGTTTLLRLCLPNALGDDKQINASGEPPWGVPNAAQPNQPS
jgi:hypothetical protein